MKDVVIKCKQDPLDELRLCEPGTRDLVAVHIITCSGEGNSVFLDADGAARVRDALNEALSEHDAQQRARRERWEAAMAQKTWEDSDGDELFVKGRLADGSVAYIDTTCGGFLVRNVATLDAIITKLTAIRDAYNEMKGEAK